METDPASLDPEERTNKFFALFSASAGLLSLCASLVPICGAILAILGLITGWFGLRSELEKVAVAGLILSTIGFLIAIFYPLLINLLGA